MRRTAAIKLVKGLATIVPPTPPHTPSVGKIPPGHPIYPELRDARDRGDRLRQEKRRTRLHFFGLAGGRRGQ